MSDLFINHVIFPTAALTNEGVCEALYADFCWYAGDIPESRRPCLFECLREGAEIATHDAEGLIVASDEMAKGDAPVQLLAALVQAGYAFDCTSKGNDQTAPGRWYWRPGMDQAEWVSTTSAGETYVTCDRLRVALDHERCKTEDQMRAYIAGLVNAAICDADPILNHATPDVDVAVVTAAIDSVLS